MTDINPLSDNTPHFIIGRDGVYARMQQHILDPSHRHALVFTGHTGMGKSALLQHFADVFDDPIFSVFSSLADERFNDHTMLLNTLIDMINHQLTQANFSMNRVPTLDDRDDDNLQRWFRDVYLPEVFTIMRSHRRLVWLLDDAETWVKFGDEITKYWHDVLATHPQFAIVMTISTDHEALLAQLSPLVNPVTAERLSRLSPDDTAELIRFYAPGANADITNAIYEATGGHPKLLARYGQALQVLWADYSDSEAFDKAKPIVYDATQDDFRQMWRKLTRDERLVLTAIASLIYDDPISNLTAKRIEAWLIETDYLLDIVAINAALRGLDYQDIVRHRSGESITLIMGLMQKWLLEQARLDDTDTQRGRISVRLIVIAGIIILILIALVLLLPPQYLDNTPSIPTATLAQ